MSNRTCSVPDCERKFVAKEVWKAGDRNGGKEAVAQSEDGQRGGRAGSPAVA